MEELEDYLVSILGSKNKSNKTYVSQGLHSIQSRHSLLKQLLIHHKLPTKGWSDNTIEYVIMQLASMDSNNFQSNVGVGEREGRLYSSIVSKRHYNLSHGIGRSGDLIEVQPKAAGSSIIYKLTNQLANHALQVAGLSLTTAVATIIMPMATGMTVTSCMLALKNKNPFGKFIIWSRIDQKSCFKSILTAGLEPLIVQQILKEVPASSLLSSSSAATAAAAVELETNIDEIKRLIEVYGNQIVAVLTTTSCFAPRQPDKVDEVGVLCKTFNIPHIINNAYGLQCKRISKLINRACTIGRVDAIVQSTDKNFLVPVGGAIVTSPDKAFITHLSSMYPGRASMTPILDLFITLLSMGVDGYSTLLAERERLCKVAVDGLNAFAMKYNETILPSRRNTISYGISIQSSHDATFFGSMLFQRNVSGCRVVSQSNKVTSVSGHPFINWGSHHNEYPTAYFTVAVSIGLTEDEFIEFYKRLLKTYQKFLTVSSKPI